MALSWRTGRESELEETDRNKSAGGKKKKATGHRGDGRGTGREKMNSIDR